MRLEISYRGGTTHEVELPGSVCVLGRDPACDVVLNDSKCSRRHAVDGGRPGRRRRPRRGQRQRHLRQRPPGREGQPAAGRHPAPGRRAGDAARRGRRDGDRRAGRLRPAHRGRGDPAARPGPPAAPGRRSSRAAGGPACALARTPGAAARSCLARSRARPATVGVLVGLWAFFVPAVRRRVPPRGAPAGRWCGGLDARRRGEHRTGRARDRDGGRPSCPRPLGPPPPDRSRGDRAPGLPPHARLGHRAPLHDPTRGEGGVRGTVPAAPRRRQRRRPTPRSPCRSSACSSSASLSPRSPCSCSEGPRWPPARR